MKYSIFIIFKLLILNSEFFFQAVFIFLNLFPKTYDGAKLASLLRSLCLSHWLCGPKAPYVSELRSGNVLE